MVRELEVGDYDCFSKQLLHGVQYMHEMGVAHRNLKPENLLLTCRGSSKISDVGCADVSGWRGRKNLTFPVGCEALSIASRNNIVAM
jgi:serine/threonine protein kinase